MTSSSADEFLAKLNVSEQRPFFTSLDDVLAYIKGLEKELTIEMKTREKAVTLLNSI